MNSPRMYYFGPLEKPGHYLYREDGWTVSMFEDQDAVCPWKHFEIDGKLQPGCPDPADRLRNRTRPMCEGEALLHHKDGWTALAFWDFTVDTRPGSSSTYIAEGILTFEEMVELAKTRFAERWKKMAFEVRLVQKEGG